MRTFKDGTKVTVNLNSEAVIIGYDNEIDMYDVRLWQGNRFVGDITVAEDRIKANEDKSGVAGTIAGQRADRWWNEHDAR